MIRLGPARSTPARGTAAVLSCAGCVMCMFGGFMLFVGIIVTSTAKMNLLPDVFDDPFFDDSRRRGEEGYKLVNALSTSGM